jgi:Na+-transporting NADH:ubiquinone oxidoreductase subunit F
MEQVLLGTAVFTGLVLALVAIVLGARALIWGHGQAHLAVNNDLDFDCPLGGKLLDALTHQNIHLPTSCGGTGTCGLCLVRLSGDEDEVLPIERAKLNTRQIKDGYRLACQVVIRGNMDIEVSPEFLGIGIWSCPVLSTRTLSPLIKEIVLAFPEGEERDMPAGSYVLVSAPAFQLPFSDIDINPEHEESWQHLGLRQLIAESRNEQSRAYSLVLRPDGELRLTLNIRLALPPATNPDAPPGFVSSYLFGLKAGDAVTVRGPYGHFFVQDGANEVVFIGGGVGMAPLYTHVYDQLQTKSTSRRVSFWYGARSLADLYYAEEMAGLAAAHENFSWHPVLSEPATGDAWGGDTGFVHEAVFGKYLKDHPAPASCEYYLCGPPLMVRAVRVMLDKLEVPKEKVFSDDFGV